MKKLIPLQFTLSIVAVILIVTLIRHFDFEHLRLVKPALDILYLIVMVTTVYILIKTLKFQ
jgi:hypothetical protein